MVDSVERTDLDIFQSLCMRAIKLLKDNYSWRNLTPSIHKLLVHGAEIIKLQPLPIAYLSEEVLEASIKYYRKYRESFSRKNSLKSNISDIFKRALVKSDPSINKQFYEINYF